ncbi:prenyltransferase [Rhodovibrio salinarum]|uniref:Prenyltransferase n=1 Tax=Rhodovibrio salinarum TaxID=1087 RepID=A0A934QK42_9PROT|nr:prenyltransferase [Rhodovibrio salinarum]MBK1698341.1 prenyltransferase [Rhodovibrio salinarum]
MAIEPSWEALGGDRPHQVAKRLLLATRPPFMSASALPVLLGTAYGAQHALGFAGVAFLLAMAATLLVTAAANVLNDVYDDISGTDPDNDSRLHPFTGGSRFIQNGVMSRYQMARWGATLAGASVVLGLLLTALAGIEVLAFGAIGLGLALAYSMPPLHFANRGLGELTVGTAFGLLPVVGAYWLQTGLISWAAVLISLPVACWVVNILLGNEIPDIRSDGQAGKRTLAVRLGPKGTHMAYLAVHTVAAIATSVAALVGLLPIWTPLLPVAIAVIAPFATRGLPKVNDPDAMTGGIKFSMLAHNAGTVWLTGCALAA